MKIFIYLLIVLPLLMVSCGKNDNSLNNITDENRVCTPYVSASFSSADFPELATDESTIIVSHRQLGDCLILDTQFSGGCEEHILQLIIDDNVQPFINLSAIIPARLSHNNTDQCTAIVSLEVYVDISKLELLQMEVVELDIENYSPIIELVF